MADLLNIYAPFIIPFLATAVGAIVGALASIFTTRMTLQHQAELSQATLASKIAMESEYRKLTFILKLFDEYRKLAHEWTVKFSELEQSILLAHAQQTIDFLEYNRQLAELSHLTSQVSLILGSVPDGKLSANAVKISMMAGKILEGLAKQIRDSGEINPDNVNEELRNLRLVINLVSIDFADVVNKAMSDSNG